MKLIDSHQKQVDNATDVSEKSSSIEMTDDELNMVAGGYAEGDSTEVRTKEGTCPHCGGSATKVTVTRSTPNGPWVYTYYECAQCGEL